MSADVEQQLRQLSFERDYAEGHVGRLYVQNQHQQQTIERLAAILQRHGIDPATGEPTNGSVLAAPVAAE